MTRRIKAGMADYCARCKEICLIDRFSHQMGVHHGGRLRKGQYSRVPNDDPVSLVMAEAPDGYRLGEF